jgi:hypothetical protein
LIGSDPLLSFAEPPSGSDQIIVCLFGWPNANHCLVRSESLFGSSKSSFGQKQATAQLEAATIRLAEDKPLFGRRQGLIWSSKLAIFPRKIHPSSGGMEYYRIVIIL